MTKTFIKNILAFFFLLEILSCTNLPSGINTKHQKKDRSEIERNSLDNAEPKAFDTKQILEDVKIPNENWGAASWLEPITRDHSQFGSGGTYQAFTNQKIQASQVTDLKNGKILYGSK